MEIWEITIYCENGPAYSILGEEDIFKAELVAWGEYQRRDTQNVVDTQEKVSVGFNDSYINTEGFEVRTVEGFSHDIGRYPAVLGYRLNEVQGMTVVRIR